MVKGVLLVNLGSPNSPSVKDVRKYLTQFLNDPLVIDINPIARFFLVNFIIVPFRAAKSAKLYKQIWTEEGSPLIIHSLKQKELLQKFSDLSKDEVNPTSKGFMDAMKKLFG